MGIGGWEEEEEEEEEEEGEGKEEEKKKEKKKKKKKRKRRRRNRRKEDEDEDEEDGVIGFNDSWFRGVSYYFSKHYIQLVHTCGELRNGVNLLIMNTIPFIPNLILGRNY